MQAVLYTQCPQPCSRPAPSHASTRDSWTLTGKLGSKFSKPGFKSTWTVNFQMFKLDLEKPEEPQIKLPTSVRSSKKQENTKKGISLLYWLHQNLCVDHNKMWKTLQEMGIPDHLTCLLRNLHAGQEATVKKQQLELDMEQQTGSKLGKE